MKFFYCFQPCILIRPSNTCLYIVCACRLRNYCSIFAIFFRTICVYYLSILSRCKRHARFLTVCPVRNTELLCPRIYCRTVRVCPKTADRTLIADSIKYCVKLICIVSSRLQNNSCIICNIVPYIQMCSCETRIFRFRRYNITCFVPYGNTCLCERTADISICFCIHICISSIPLAVLISPGEGDGNARYIISVIFI